MTEASRSKTFRAQGDTGVVYTVVETHHRAGEEEATVSYALSDGRELEDIGDRQFRIAATGEIITWI